MNSRLIVWSIVSALAGFLFGFDTIVSGAEKTIQIFWGLLTFIATLLITFFTSMVELIIAGFVFLFFFLLMVLQLIWVQFMVPETKGQSLEQIERAMEKS